MRVNNINNLNFTRGIEIVSNKNDLAKWKDKKIDKSTMAVIDTISDKEPSIYDKETSTKIGEFLRAAIGDYDVKSGVVTRKIEGHYYIFTGEEARRVRRIERNAHKEKQRLEARYAKGPTPDMPLSEQVELKSESLHRILRQNIGIDRDKEILSLVENGQRRNRPDTKIKLEIGDDGRLKRARYSSFKNDGRTGTMSEKTLTL